MFEFEDYQKDKNLRDLENDIYSNFLAKSGLFYDESSLTNNRLPSMDEVFHPISPNVYIFDRSKEYRKNIDNKIWLGTSSLIFLLE